MTDTRIKNTFEISDMSKRLKKKLVKQIYRLCEKQYRKGVQQGIHFYAEKKIDLDMADKFRFDGAMSNYKYAVSPLFYNKKIYKNTPYKNRFKYDIYIGETAASDFDELRFLLREVNNK